MSGEANVENACPAAAASVGHAARSLPHTTENSARTETTRQLGFIRKPIKKNSDISELDWNWWPRPGSNRRHTDFQSVALPTELPSPVRENGRSAGIRTLDPVIKSHLLYQLSYAPIHHGLRGARNGTRTRDNHLGKVALYQLSYPRITKTSVVYHNSPSPRKGEFYDFFKLEFPVI